MKFQGKPGLSRSLKANASGLRKPQNMEETLKDTGRTCTEMSPAQTQTLTTGLNFYKIGCKKKKKKHH